jgi:putative endonuclease
MYKVYILLCADNSFYVGYTNNLHKRLKDHNSKQGSFYLHSKLPVKLVYYENYDTRIEATQRERQLKGWTRVKKINLIKYGHPTKIYNKNFSE